MVVCQSGQPIPDSTFCRRFIESVRMMACVNHESRWEAIATVATFQFPECFDIAIGPRGWLDVAP